MRLWRVGFPGTPSLDSIHGQVVHSAVKSIGSFSASTQVLNDIRKIIRWSQVTNLMGVPTDCDQRDERQGWMGDAQAAWARGFTRRWRGSISRRGQAGIAICASSRGRRRPAMGRRNGADHPRHGSARSGHARAAGRWDSTWVRESTRSGCGENSGGRAELFLMTNTASWRRCAASRVGKFARKSSPTSREAA